MTALFHNWKTWRLHCMSGSIKGYFEDNITGKVNAFLQWLTDARINVTIWKNMVMQVKHNGNQDYINNFWNLTSRKHVCMWSWLHEKIKDLNSIQKKTISNDDDRGS